MCQQSEGEGAYLRAREQAARMKQYAEEGGRAMRSGVPFSEHPFHALVQPVQIESRLPEEKQFRTNLWFRQHHWYGAYIAAWERGWDDARDAILAAWPEAAEVPHEPRR